MNAERVHLNGFGAYIRRCVQSQGSLSPRINSIELDSHKFHPSPRALHLTSSSLLAPPPPLAMTPSSVGSFEHCPGSRSSRLRAWCDLPRCRPTERVSLSRCIHETHSESTEELRQASSSSLIPPSAAPTMKLDTPAVAQQYLTDTRDLGHDGRGPLLFL